MSRCGFRASWAAVETASKPMYAKKITAAPRMMPDQPNSPNVPVFGGISGVKLVASTNHDAGDDHEQHDGDLDDHHDAVHRRGFAHAAHEQRGHEQRR